MLILQQDRPSQGCHKCQCDLRLKQEAKETKDKVLVAEPSSVSTSGSSSASVEQLQADLARFTTLVSAMQSQSTASFGNFGASSCPSSDEWYCGTMALTALLVSNITWVLDTGATEHMTPFNHRFVSYEKHLGSRSVLTAGGGRLHVAGIGAILVDGLGVVRNVLHVPSLLSVLMSPQRLVDELL